MPLLIAQAGCGIIFILLRRSEHWTKQDNKNSEITADRVNTFVEKSRLCRLTSYKGGKPDILLEAGTRPTKVTDFFL